MYVYREEGGLLSLLNGGRGMVKGGVGLNCLDSGTSLTLTGKSLLRPSQHGNGTTAAPYKTRELAIPQAYVMQRGHKVFFTAAEDMVIGSKCNLIQKELQERERVCREVADVTVTTSRLNEKATSYEETDERVRDTLPPGHYNKFYLDYLQQTQTHESEVFESGIRVDELEGGSRKDVPPATDMDTSGGGGRGFDSDSGIGASNVTSTDRLTPFSDMTVYSGGGGGTSTTLLTPDKDKAVLDFAMGACAVDKSSAGKGKKGSKAKKSGKGKKGKKFKSETRSDEPKPVASKKKKASTKGSKKTATPDTTTAATASSVSKKHTKTSDSTTATGPHSGVAKKQSQASKKRSQADTISSSACQEKAGKGSARRFGVHSGVSSLELKHEEEEERRMRVELEAKEEAVQRRKEQHNAAMHRDLSSLQTGQSISRPWTFSYFSLVPPPKVKVAKKQGTRAGTLKS